jgi:hypothetical protein
MSEMFEEAVSFSGKGLGSWVVSNVMYMYSMVRSKAFCAACTLATALTNDCWNAANSLIELLHSLAT